MVWKVLLTKCISYLQRELRERGEQEAQRRRVPAALAALDFSSDEEDEESVMARRRRRRRQAMGVEEGEDEDDDEDDYEPVNLEDQRGRFCSFLPSFGRRE